MKKAKKKIGVVIAVIIVAILVSLVIWQWSNIQAIYMGVAYSDKKIEEKIEKSKEELAKKLEKEGIVDEKIIAGFSKEDEEKLAKGEITVEEAVEKLFESDDKPSDETVVTDKPEEVKDNQEDKPNPNPEENKTTSNTQTDVNNNVNNQPKQPENTVAPSTDNSSAKGLIEAAVKQLYTLKASYVQQLAAIERSAIKMYVEGEMTQERKLEIADSFMPQLVDAERSCDSQVDAILEDLRNGLVSVGADTSVVQVIKQQYQQEKQLQKSKYISKYM